MQLGWDDFTGPRRQAGGEGDECWFQVCPVCGSLGWKTYVNRRRGFWYCHAADHGRGGRLRDCLGALDLVAAAPRVRDFPVVQVPETDPLGKMARRYLAARGLSERQQDLLGVREGTGDLLYRVVFPYADVRGRSVYWNARAYSRQAVGPKYVGAPGDKPCYVPGAWRFRRPLVLVEGVFDALSVWSKTDFAVAAIGGTHLSRRQQKQIVSLHPTEIMIMLDGDALGKSLRLLTRLATVAPVRLVASDRDKDPGMMSEEELCRALCSRRVPHAQSAQPASDPA